MASRWDKVGPIGDGKDYINCPMDKEQYYTFVQGLVEGEKTAFKDWETDTPYFEGCMPIEVMAERGVETLRFGPMKGRSAERRVGNECLGTRRSRWPPYP